MEQGAQVSTSQQNTFQGRYVILHPWEGAIDCQTPQRGRWGGPPGSYEGSPPTTFPSQNAAMSGGIAASELQGEAMLAGTIDWDRGQAAQASTSLGGTVPLAPRGGCATCTVGSGEGRAMLALGGLALVGIVIARRRRRR